MRRRMAERRRRRALPGETEREGNGKRDLRLHHLDAKLLEGSNTAKKRRNGGVAENSELPTMAAALARVLRGRRLRLRFEGFKGCGRRLL